MTNSNNKRLAKNTLILYFRMIVSMTIGLFTSRIVLNSLGVEDYGINNVVAGFVSMFTFLNNTLASGTQRFLTYALGENDFNKQKTTFSTTLIVHIIMSVIFAIIIFTVGFSMMKGLNIPDSRVDAAIYVFICSTITIILGITQVPYSASMVAHEDMSIYAYMTIFDSVTKLIVACSLFYANSVDKLKLYATLLLAFSVINLLVYRIYCIKKYPECRFSFIYNKEILKSIMTFSGWSIIGNIAALGNGQGVNVTLNLFFGPVVNAAKGISGQVNSLVTGFVENFQTAVNPQIIKLYASHEYDKFNNLIYNSSKFSGLLTLYIFIPVSIEIKFLLQLWLGEFPEETTYFTQISLLQSMIIVLSRPIVTGLHSTGKLKWPNLLAGSVLLLIVPITYVLLSYGVNLNLVLLINIIPWLFHCFIDGYILGKYTGFSVLRFYRCVYIPVLTLFVTCYTVLNSLYSYIPNPWIRILVILVANSTILSILIYFIVLTKKQKEQTKIVLLNYINKIH